MRRPSISLRSRWPPRAIPAAICLCLVAVVVFLVWWLDDVSSLDPWIPNIVVGLVAIAATITLVEAIIQREHQQSVQPRYTHALDQIGQALLNFAFQTHMDYVFTHREPVNPAEMNIPSDPVALCDFWVEGQDKNDSRRPTKDGRSLFLGESLEFVSRVQRVADSNRELLPSELVVAIDSLDPIFTGAWLADLSAEVKERGATGLDDWLLFVLVPGVGRVGESFRRVAGDRRFVLFDNPAA